MAVQGVPLKPQEPPPAGKPYAVTRSVITTTFHSSMAEAQDEYGMLVEDDKAFSPQEDGVQVTLWDHASNTWEEIHTESFPAKPQT